MMSSPHPNGRLPRIALRKWRICGFLLIGLLFRTKTDVSLGTLEGGTRFPDVPNPSLSAKDTDKPLSSAISGCGSEGNFRIGNQTATIQLGYGINSVWRYPVSCKSAFNASRAIVLLSMGPGAAESTLVERCIISIRRRGEYLDPIMILTDSPLGRYEDLTEHDPNVIVLQPLLKDWNWDLRRDMPYKRFKTYVLDYLTRDVRLATVKLLYYLDIDIVVGQPLDVWFDHVERRYLMPDSTYSSEIILFEGNIGPVQGGQFLVKTNYSESCLEQWRQYIDSNPIEHKDQSALTLIWDEQNSRGKAPLSCHLSRMPQDPFLRFLSAKEMSQLKRPGSSYPTLMHIKNTQHASTIPDSLQKEFFLNLLGLPSDLMVNITGKKRIRPNRTWSAIQMKGFN